ncbi:NACHT, LRR and PYD domains-containing protein 12-like isoform X2 [Hoplias malabaricus]|uniref:NACHT, LRR and PYD domains-containing protein 12-like isoform X2 n=1 Tax=Hoplias malabaricus TaxID=27720 RepID=UPI00346310AE
MEDPHKLSTGGREPSCVSMKSDCSKVDPPYLSSGDVPSDPEVQKKTPDRTRKNMESIFKELEQRVISVVKNHLKRFMKLLSEDYPACSEREEEEEDDVRDGVMKITLNVLRNMNNTHLAHTLQSKLAPSSHRKLKSTLKKKFQKINEGIFNPGSSALLNEIYTDLYITEGGSGEVNTEHEVRQIETVSRRPVAQEKPIKCSELFKDKAIRTVLTKGVAGIGKTVSVQKFILDWAEGKENQDILFIFPLPFRELNLMKEKKLSLMELLHQFFKNTTQLKPRDYDLYSFLFIFDGLDECRLPLDFQKNEGLWDVTQSASVDVLLTNLIKGNLLPSALLWITSRSAAANQIPPECVTQVTEIRGFSDPQKEQYFRKRISDQSLANQIISHIKSSRSLYIMCHIPVFCWISAMVLERVLGGAEGGESPKTLTQMFTHFLIFQIKHKEQKYQVKQEVDPQKTRECVLALGKLAFQQLEKGNLIFYEDDLRECGIDVREISVYSGVCTQIFREEFGLHLGKVFSFVHLSVQEFLAALYAFLSFISRDEPEQSSTDLSEIFRESTMSKFLRSAVDKALQSENGHLDLFLRFLLGLSLESNQTLLRGILTQTGIRSHSREETVQYIKEKIRENPSPEKTINLFHCLNELNDHSLVQEVQEYLNRGGSLSGVRFSPGQWSAVAFVLLNSEEELDEFDLRKYNPSAEGVLRLLPVIKASRKAVLADSNLTKDTCETLGSALQSVNSSLKQLDLSNNDLHDSGVELLSAGLKSSLCKLETLRLSGCMITDEGCTSLASALKSNSSHLRELDLTYNHPGESGVKLLSDLLQDPLCVLEKLQLAGCNLTKNSCETLGSALQSVNLLKELDLSNNDLQDSGVELLSAGLKSSLCKLETLRLSGCMIKDEGCSSLASALKLIPSHLKELDLSYNHPGDSGVKLLSDLLQDSHCVLEKLQLSGCNLTKESCKTLGSSLQSLKSILKELDLSNNDLQDSGVEQLSAGLKSSLCKLETLRLSGCMITGEGCSSVASALTSNPSHLRELDLSYNHPGESGVKLLSDLLQDPQCALEKLQVQHGGISRMRPGPKKCSECGEFNWTLLLGGGEERVGFNLSVVQRNQEERSRS